MKGKERCKILKEIRQRIAEENNIEFITSECRHQGDCRGTCPKCEAEVRYLERELERRARLGKAVAVAGVAATIAFSAVGCTDEPVTELGGDIAIEQPSNSETSDGLIAEPEGENAPIPDETPDSPDVPYINENGEEDILMGEPVEIAGDIATFYFFPEKPEDFDEYDQSFINNSLSGMNIETIKDTWGEPDMSQERDEHGAIGYFTDMHDIVIHYELATGTVINASAIENA